MTPFTPPKKKPGHDNGRACGNISSLSAAAAARSSLALGYGLALPGLCRLASGGNTATARRCLASRGYLAATVYHFAICSHAAVVASRRTAAACFSGGSYGCTRHIGRNRCPGCTNCSSQCLALVIGTVVATLLARKILTVCRIHLINVGDCIREVMIRQCPVALTGCQKTGNHCNQTKNKLTSAEHNAISIRDRLNPPGESVSRSAG